MDTVAVLLSAPEALRLSRTELVEPDAADVVVDVEWSGISTGTEKLLFTGRMPPFPGLGYPLVPGYESVGRVVVAGPSSGRTVGERVFVPGSRGFRDARGLFGGAASRLVTPGARVVPTALASPTPASTPLAEDATLLALAATAHHALAAGAPDLVVGQGVLGRLIARLAVALGHPAPALWERDPARREPPMLDPQADRRRDYRRVVDCSGDGEVLDALLDRLAPGGEIVLAGFYPGRVSFAFPAAFMREARLRVAAEWTRADMDAVLRLLAGECLSLGGLVTHRAAFAEAPAAYRTAFGDAACLKMILDWRNRP